MILDALSLPAAADAEEWVATRATEGLDRARELAETLRSAPPADALDALEVWDELSLELSNVAAVGSLFSNVHPLEPVRDTAERAEQDAMRLSTELSLDRAIYDVFAGLDPARLDEQAARLLDKVLETFTRAGVAGDDETRARVTAINERITEVDQQFGKVIRDDVRSIRVAPDRLDGMPADWIAAHPVDDEGLVSVTTDYPDAIPLRMFAHDAEIRRELTVQFLTRGWPETEGLLTELFDLRHELATLVGYDDWASYDADVKMIKKGRAIPEFIERIAAAAEEPMRRDLELLYERYRRDVPDAATIDAADGSYYQELVRKEHYDVDSQVVRRYFGFDRVRQGLLDVTGRLFGLRYEPVDDVELWSDEVTAYDVYDGAGGERLGRIFLDLHPREGKYKHAAQFTLTEGVLGRQLPEGVLVCNFPAGLMEHDHVVTLFHEFGHLVHHVLGGRGRWTRFAGVATEWDFVEAPSQMLEEWAWDAAVLQTFATDEAGEPIPSALVERMRRADDYGKGIYARTQMYYAAMSYWFHADRPADLTARMIELQEQYAPFAYIDGTRMFASFGHLAGYSSAYYTYMWSLVIAKDLFSAFGDDMFEPDVARRYRDRVLAPGGSKDAADLVADFLGRPYTFDAYADWLAR